MEHILKEVHKVFSISDFRNVPKLIDSIVNSKKIVLVGAGRVGYATKAFAMRLKHMGLDAYMIGDSNVPSIGKEDLLIVSSGSGETQTIFDLATIARNNTCKIVLITGNPNSRIGKISNIIINLRAPSKVKQISGFESSQPMTTLNEQSLWIFFDALVLELMQKMGENHETMWKRHSNLE